MSLCHSITIVVFDNITRTQLAEISLNLVTALNVKMYLDFVFVQRSDWISSYDCESKGT